MTKTTNLPSPKAFAAMNEEQLIASAEKKIDMLKPLVWQIHHLDKAEYMPWVHKPFSYAKTGMKQAILFQWSFLEPLSYTMWWMIPAIWVPTCLYFWSYYFTHPEATLQGGIGLLLTGLATWTFLEYAIHRFLFHIDALLPNNGWLLTLHFLLHGVHHRVPNDPYRLVMPPALFFALAATLLSMLRPLLSFMPDHCFYALAASGVLGYVGYDMVHYSQHHATNLKEDSYWYKMRQYHMKHHYAGLHNIGFGITNKFWDNIFGTVLTPEMWRRKPAPEALDTKGA